MIQRVQTLYLGIAIILLSIVTFGAELVSFSNETTRYTFNSYGMLEYAQQSGDLIGKKGYPLYIATIALILLCFLCIMSYKSLARQFRLGRMIFFIYFLNVVLLVLFSTLGDGFIDEQIQSREMGLGFLLFVAGFPFTFLANVGIKRDKKLLESVDRIR